MLWLRTRLEILIDCIFGSETYAQATKTMLDLMIIPKAKWERTIFRSSFSSEFGLPSVPCRVEALKGIEKKRAKQKQE